MRSKDFFTRPTMRVTAPRTRLTKESLRLVFQYYQGTSLDDFLSLDRPYADNLSPPRRTFQAAFPEAHFRPWLTEFFLEYLIIRIPEQYDFARRTIKGNTSLGRHVRGLRLEYGLYDSSLDELLRVATSLRYLVVSIAVAKEMAATSYSMRSNARHLVLDFATEVEPVNNSEMLIKDAIFRDLPQWQNLERIDFGRRNLGSFFKRGAVVHFPLSLRKVSVSFLTLDPEWVGGSCVSTILGSLSALPNLQTIYCRDEYNPEALRGVVIPAGTPAKLRFAGGISLQDIYDAEARVRRYFQAHGNATKIPGDVWEHIFNIATRNYPFDLNTSDFVAPKEEMYYHNTNATRRNIILVSRWFHDLSSKNLYNVPIITSRGARRKVNSLMATVQSNSARAKEVRVLHWIPKAAPRHRFNTILDNLVHLDQTFRISSQQFKGTDGASRRANMQTLALAGFIDAGEKITTDFFNDFRNLHSLTLRYVDVEFRHRHVLLADDKSQFWDKLPQLTHLKVVDSSNWVFEMLSNMRLPNLKKLELDRNYSQAVLKFMKRHGNSLEVLTVANVAHYDSEWDTPYDRTGMNRGHKYTGADVGMDEHANTNPIDARDTERIHASAPDSDDASEDVLENLNADVFSWDDDSDSDEDGDDNEPGDDEYWDLFVERFPFEALPNLQTICMKELRWPNSWYVIHAALHFHSQVC
ncbi:hypothetical protein EUX98_g3607 [Antrodiella citrinella]|uniref:Uncharacterized protein n=1 Tax=Antrodiella citrinella TaxID=2447956 RepID=A0A4S4MX83_9APHY|nr:hypothetical protein EUX98_g3607 [Antrodiella citrinella]